MSIELIDLPTAIEIAEIALRQIRDNAQKAFNQLSDSDSDSFVHVITKREFEIPQTNLAC